MINQAQWINGWFYKATLTYPQFVQAREYERSFRYSIDEQTKTLIANENDLAEAHISTLREQNAILAEINATVSTKLDEINGTLNWGFTEVIASIGRVNDRLADLVKIARTPAQTWAYEQYDIARDAYRKALYSESLRYLDRAINGAAGNAGYDLDFRFHFLKGLIHLGSVKNTDPALVSMTAAEAAFLLAARYSETDYPQDAARSFLLAGRAAYCDRRLDRACEHTDKCVSLAPQPIAEAYFQRAKILCASGQRSDAAAEDVIRAIGLDRVYGLKIASDGDLSPYQDTIMGRLDVERRKLKDEVSVGNSTIMTQLAERETAEISGFAYAECELDSFNRMSDLVTKVAAKLADATYYGLCDSMDLLQELRKSLTESWSRYRNVVMAAITTTHNEARQRETSHDKWGIACTSGMIGAAFSLIVLFSSGNILDKILGLIGCIILFAPLGFVIGLIVVAPIARSGIRQQLADCSRIQRETETWFDGMNAGCVGAANNASQPTSLPRRG